MSPVPTLSIKRPYTPEMHQIQVFIDCKQQIEMMYNNPMKGVHAGYKAQIGNLGVNAGDDIEKTETMAWETRSRACRNIGPRLEFLAVEGF